MPLVASVATAGLGMLVSGLVAMAVAWWIIGSGRDIVWAGVASFAIQLPVALGLALGGSLVDRLGSRRILVASNLLTLAPVAIAAITVVSGFDDLSVLVGLLALANFLGAPGNVAQDARVPELARLAGLPLERANGLRDLAQMAAQAAGPALGVALVGMGGLLAALTMAVLLLAAIAMTDALLFPRFPCRRRPSGAEKSNQRHCAAAAFAKLARDPVLRAVVLLGVALVAAFASLDEIVAPALAAGAGLGSATLALFLGLSGGGAFLSGLAFTAYGHLVASRSVFVVGIAVAAAGFLALAALPVSIGFLVAPVLIGAGVGPLSPLVSTVLQRRTPAAQRGSILGAFAASILIAQPFAALGAAPLVAAVGLAWVTWALAALAVSAAVAAALLSDLRKLDP